MLTLCLLALALTVGGSTVAAAKPRSHKAQRGGHHAVAQEHRDTHHSRTARTGGRSAPRLAHGGADRAPDSAGRFHLAAAAHLGVPGAGEALFGNASWYAPRRHLVRTASGAPLDAHRLTAAHRTLPMGSHVKVTNLRNGRSVVVEINDRGPTGRNLLIDLSQQAAEVIGFKRDGVAPVSVEPIPLVPVGAVEASGSGS